MLAPDLMPTSDDILARRRRLSPDQLRQLEQRLRGDRASTGPQAITRRGQAEAPLSLCQQGRRFLVQLMGGNSSYFNSVVAYRIRGALDVAVLERALSEIEVRHEILRTTIDMMSYPETQRIHDPQPFSLVHVDLSELPPDERAREARRVVDVVAVEPIDNAVGPVWRGHLIRLADDDHVLSLLIDHFMSDPWSGNVFARELSALYAAFARGLPSPLEPLAIQYADWALWEREWLVGDELDRQRDYWTGQLAGLQSLQLGERPAGRSWSTTGSVEPIHFDRDASAALRSLSRAHHVTPAMTILAAFKALLALEAGQEEVALATFNLNRTRPEIENLIGLFVNILILRTDLSGDPSFATLLERERAVILGALSHASLPGSELIAIPGALEAINRDRQDWIVYHFRTLSSSGLQLPGLDVGPFDIYSRDPEMEFPTGPIDLHLVMQERDGCFTGTLAYNRALFDRPTILGMVDRLRTVLATGVTDPGRRLKSLLDG